MIEKIASAISISNKVKPCCPEIFVAAFDDYHQAEEPIAQAESQMYRAEALWYLQRQSEAKQLFASVNQALLPPHRHTDLQRIRQLLQP